jgi:hypothetical protein
MDSKNILRKSEQVPDHRKSPAMKFQEKWAKMEVLFGAGAGKFVDDRPIRGLFGSIDIVALDDWFHEKFGNYDADEKTSMADFITAKFGAEACKWVKDNMDAVM